MTPIERFAEEQMGIKLFPKQVEMILAMAEGRVLLYPNRAGKSTAGKVARAYLAEACKPEQQNE